MPNISKTDEFLGKFQTAFGPPSFSESYIEDFATKILLQIYALLDVKFQGIKMNRTFPSPSTGLTLILKTPVQFFLNQLLLLLVCKIILQESVGLASFQEVVTIRSSRRQI